MVSLAYNHHRFFFLLTLSLYSRTRKIRCDGAKPACHNCSRRTTGSKDECSYDPVPKRRGPDKTPGARQRMARDSRGDSEAPSAKRRRRRDTSATDVTSVSASSSGSGPMTPRVEFSAVQSIALAPPPGSIDHSSYSPPPDAFPATSAYARSYSPSCACHGLVSSQCPDLLGASALPEYRKPTGAVRNLIF